MTKTQITDRRLDVYRLQVCTHPAEEGLLALDRLKEDGSLDAMGPLLDRQAARVLAEALRMYADTRTLCTQQENVTCYSIMPPVEDTEMQVRSIMPVLVGTKKPWGYAG